MGIVTGGVSKLLEGGRRDCRQALRTRGYKYSLYGDRGPKVAQFHMIRYG